MERDIERGNSYQHTCIRTFNLFIKTKVEFKKQTRKGGNIPGSNLRLFELKPVFVLHPLRLEVGGALMEKFFCFLFFFGCESDFTFLVLDLSFFFSQGSVDKRRDHMIINK